MLNRSALPALATASCTVLALSRIAFSAPLSGPARAIAGVGYMIKVNADVVAGTDAAASMPNLAHGYTGHAVFAAHRGRLDITTGGVDPLFAAGDYILFDSTDIVIVHPPAHAYVAVPTNAASQTMQQLQSLGATVKLNDVKVTLDSLGAGDKVDGFPTRHFRMTTAFNMAIDAGFMQQSLGNESVTDYWVADVPGLPGNVLLRASGLSGAPIAAGAFKELSLKVDSVARRMGTAVALKSITTNRLIQGPGASVTTRETADVSDIRHESVEESALMLPADYKQAALPGLPPPTSDPGGKWRLPPRD